MKRDPITLEILNNKLAAAADEMFFALQRSSRSAYVKEGADFGTALLDRGGRVVGYPPSATVQFLLDMDCAPTIDAVGDLAPGDVIVANDPYSTAALSTHLPDIHMIKPYFHGDEVVAYGWCFIHCTDVGGRVPSSISPSSNDIFQEGLIIPPMKIVRGGVLNQDFMTIFEANCRIPETNRGDLRAMIGALDTGAVRVAAMIEGHGLEGFLQGHRDLQDYAADKARAALRLIPDGRYVFWDYMDDDLVTPIPTRIRVAFTVADGTVNIDVSGTDPQVAAAYNVPTAGGRNYWLTMRLTSFMATHDKTMPMNAGLYRHITVTNPPGTVMNAEFPDAVGVRHASARRVNDALTGCILKAAPDRMAAPTCGSSCPLVLAEYDREGVNRTVTVLEPMRGGSGARRGADGVDCRDATMSNMQNHPVETIEAEYGVLIRDYDIRPDSGGPGQWRGGCGQKVTVQILRDGSTLLARGMERMRFPAWGVGGGRPGQPFRATFNEGKPGGHPIPKIDALAVNAGDTVTLLNPGASGFGDPFERDPALVARDVTEGFVGRESATQDYGVLLHDDGTVDADATRKARQSRVRQNVRADFDFGPEREAWEAVFDDATMEDLNRRLYALPKSIRFDRRRQVFATAVPDLPRPGAAPLTEVLADADAVRARLSVAMDELLGVGEARASE